MGRPTIGERAACPWRPRAWWRRVMGVRHGHGGLRTAPRDTDGGATFGGGPMPRAPSCRLCIFVGGNRHAGDPRAAEPFRAIVVDAGFARVPGLRCATCCAPALALQDGVVVPGVVPGARNTPTPLDLARLETAFFWDGRAAARGLARSALTRHCAAGRARTRKPCNDGNLRRSGPSACAASLHAAPRTVVRSER